MPTNDDLLRNFKKVLDAQDPKTIYSRPSEEQYGELLDSLLDTTKNLEDALAWGESFPMTESFESRQLITVSDLFRIAGQSELIGSAEYLKIKADVDELIGDYAPSSSITVDDVLAYFSITNQADLEKMRIRRNSQRLPVD
jgi:hypothetical protein